MKLYQEITTNFNYTEQQNTLKKACDELGLAFYRPNYHGEKGDGCTVLVYTKEAHEANKRLEEANIYFTKSYVNYVAEFSNPYKFGATDFDFFGGIDCRGLWGDKLFITIKDKLQDALTTYDKEKEKKLIEDIDSYRV